MTNEQSQKDVSDGALKNKKFDKRKIKCHNCGFMGHFKSECKNPSKEKTLMAQLGYEGNMMLMCELVDEKDPVSSSAG